MRILHLSAVDYGGAGSAALRLHEAMRGRGVDSRMLVWERRNDTLGVIAVGGLGTGALFRWLGRAWFSRTTRRPYLFRNQRTSAVSAGLLNALVLDHQPDLIVVHYISDFLSFKDVENIQRTSGARVVFHLLDMGLLTGGCHYAWGCTRYRETCGECPALPHSILDDASSRTIVGKMAATRTMDHVVVVPSSQLAMDAKCAAPFRHSRIHLIPLGVDSEQLGKYTRDEARKLLDLPSDQIVLFFGAQQIWDPRKGMRLLVDALKLIADVRSPEGRAVMLLIAGCTADAGPLKDVRLPSRNLGFVDSDTLSLAYASADVFICPSIEDSGPMMVNEAMMAGTPVIGFRIGVLPDLVVDGKTGMLAVGKSAVQLAAAIASVLGWDDARRAAARASCRSRALEKCSLDAQVEGFLSIVAEGKT